eukprot:828650_1
MAQLAEANQINQPMQEWIKDNSLEEIAQELTSLTLDDVQISNPKVIHLMAKISNPKVIQRLIAAIQSIEPPKTKMIFLSSDESSVLHDLQTYTQTIHDLRAQLNDLLREYQHKKQQNIECIQNYHHNRMKDITRMNDQLSSMFQKIRMLILEQEQSFKASTNGYKQEVKATVNKYKSQNNQITIDMDDALTDMFAALDEDKTHYEQMHQTFTNTVNQHQDPNMESKDSLNHQPQERETSIKELGRTNAEYHTKRMDQFNQHRQKIKSFLERDVLSAQDEKMSVYAVDVEDRIYDKIRKLLNQHIIVNGIRKNLECADERKEEEESKRSTIASTEHQEHRNGITESKENESFSFGVPTPTKHESFIDDPSLTFKSFNVGQVPNVYSALFGSRDWNFAPPTKEEDVAVNNDNNDDNMVHATFKPIVNLEEQTVDTGHEDETLIVEIPFVKLYRFGKDVAQVPCWKIRASKSNVYLYQSCTSGKIRIIAREHETNKLRMNQFVPKSEDSSFALKSSNVYQWTAYDASIATEKDDEAAGFTMWCIKLSDTDNADLFENEFRKAMQVNDSISWVTDHDIQTEIQVKQEEDTVNLEEQTVEEEEEDETLIVEEEEIAKEAKCKRAQEAAKLFAGSNDNNGNEVTTWKMPNDLFESTNTDKESANTFANYDFEKHRGVDLEAEKIMNKIKTDPNVSFGVSGNDANESSNVKPVATFSFGSTSPSSANVIISEKAEPGMETEIFQHRPVKAWRWDVEQKKWRGRGKGQLTVYKHRMNHRAKIVFADEKHHKTRLLQWIDGDTPCEFSPQKQDEIEWYGADYTMDLQDPLVGTWKLSFMHDAKAQQFMNVFNGLIIGNLDIASFSFQAEPEDTSSGPQWDDLSGGLSSVKPTEGFGNIVWGQDGGGFRSFGDSGGFNIDALITENQQPEEQNDDNGNYTLKPIVSLKEVEVETGHDNERELKSFDIAKLYRWGKDVSQQPCWKARASKTSITFYQHNSTGKIRMVCRENITNKLRLNQNVATSLIVALSKKSEKQISWRGMDSTIAEEDENDAPCMFIAKFAEEDTAEAFHNMIASSAQNNENNMSNMEHDNPSNRTKAKPSMMSKENDSFSNYEIAISMSKLEQINRDLRQDNDKLQRTNGDLRQEIERLKSKAQKESLDHMDTIKTLDSFTQSLQAENKRLKTENSDLNEECKETKLELIRVEKELRKATVNTSNYLEWT